MPTIPVIQDSAQLQTSTGRRSVQADANDFGAHEARGTANLAQGVNALGEMAEDKDDEFNEANARELDNELSRRIRDRLYNTESGYLSTQRGRNALDSRAQIEADIDGMAAELETTARNPRAAALYRNVAQRRVGSAMGDIATHSARENISYQNEISEAALQETIDNAVAAYSDPAVVAANRDTALTEIQRLADRNGWDPSVRDQRIRQFQSDVSSRVLVQLAATDPEQAEAYFQSIAPSLTAQDRAELSSTMRAARRQAEDRIIDEAWSFVASGQAIPRDLWARVPGRAQIDIQNERQRRADGGAGTGNRSLIADLNIMAVADPQGFARYDLRAVRGQLGESAYQNLGEQQARARRGEDRAGISREQAQGAMTLAARQLRAAGYDLSADADEEEAQAVAEFQADLIGLLDRFAEENGGRAPNAQEQLGTVMNLLATRSHNPAGLFNRREWRATDAYTSLAQIPPGDRQAIEARLRAEGIAVTRANIERVYEMRESERLRVGRR